MFVETLLLVIILRFDIFLFRLSHLSLCRTNIASLCKYHSNYINHPLSGSAIQYQENFSTILNIKKTQKTQNVQYRFVIYWVSVLGLFNNFLPKANFQYVSILFAVSFPMMVSFDAISSAQKEIFPTNKSKDEKLKIEIQSYIAVWTWLLIHDCHAACFGNQRDMSGKMCPMVTSGGLVTCPWFQQRVYRRGVC